MNAPRIPPRSDLPDPLQRIGQSKLWQAGAMLWLMRLVHAFWPFSLIVKLYLTAALFGLFGYLGPLPHVLLLLAFAGGAVVSFIWGWRHYRSITPAEARRAVERASGLAHRPLTTLADKPIKADPLWSQHLGRMAGMVRQVPLRLPRLQVTMPLRIRWVALSSWAVLLCAVVWAWDDMPKRLEDAVSPEVARFLPISRLDGWVTPPDYAGQPPIALNADHAQLSAPEGSVLTLRVNGGWFTPVAELPTGRVRLQPQPDGSYLLTAPLPQAGPISVRQDGHSLGKWKLTLVVDSVPQIDFKVPPTVTPQSALRIDYVASDDLGLASVKAVIELAKHAADAKVEPITLPFSLAATPPREAQGFRFFDLTAHPWAGSDVHITLYASDVKGQTSESTPILFKLPERRFTNPIAKTLISIRRELTLRGWAPVRAQAPLTVDDLQQQARQDHPGDWLGALALNSISGRIRFNLDPAVMPSVQQMMWDTALHFEDGGTGDALAALRQAQQDLEEALANNASDAEIEHLLNELEQAMQNYMQELAKQPPQPGQENKPTQQVEMQDLKNMMDAIRNMAQSGARDQARQMLSQMQQMMENMQRGGSGSSDPATQEALEKLEGIAREQGEMMQRQFNPQPGQSRPQAGEQGELQERLEGVGKELSDRGMAVPELGESAGSMGEAESSLQRGQGEQALQQQGEALTSLQEGIGQLREQMARQQGEGLDPMGRSQGQTGSNTSKIEIPDRQEAERARRLLEELRGRASDPGRPTDERNYLERLLKWF